jgi:hypothetical protein
LDPESSSIEGAEAAKLYVLTLKGEGMSVERQIDEDTALDVLSLVMGGGGSPVARDATTMRAPATTRRNGQLSLREYLDEVKATRNPDKILAIAKYATGATGKNTVTRDDVRARFKDAAEKVPGNYGRDFRWVVKNGWLAADADDKKEFYVTDTGNEALAQKFSTAIKKKTGVTKGRRGGRRRTSTKAS